MQKSFEVTGPVRLDVHLSSGLIEVEPTLDGHVEVELIAHDAESQQLVDAARVELRGSGERLEVVVDVPARPKSWSLGNLLGRQTISCRIQCPAGSDLKARSKSADIRVRGTLGEVDVATASGESRRRHARRRLDQERERGPERRLGRRPGDRQHGVGRRRIESVAAPSSPTQRAATSRSTRRGRRAGEHGQRRHQHRRRHERLGRRQRRIRRRTQSVSAAGRGFISTAPPSAATPARSSSSAPTSPKATARSSR